ncbi:MAG: class I SAM-dependent methyltransferase [Sulfolobaceae archaeon]|nr:class I SAM-dependent methyltransferase [Sulfolobaceae archaeon]
MPEIYGYPEDLWFELYSKRGKSGYRGGEEIKEILEANGVVKGSKVLDLGCGTGRISNYLSKHGYRVVGIDLCSPCIAMAKSEGPLAEYVVQDYNNLGIRGSFDAVLSILSFSWDNDDNSYRFFSNVRSLLRENGVFVFQVAIRELVFQNPRYTSIRRTEKYVEISDHNFDIRTGKLVIVSEVYEGEESSLRLVHTKREEIYIPSIVEYISLIEGKVGMRFENVIYPSRPLSHHGGFMRNSVIMIFKKG